MATKKSLFSGFLCIILFMSISCVHAGALVYKTSCVLDGQVKALAIEDIDSDSREEMIVATEKSLYVLNASCGIENQYSVNFPVSALYFGDYDGDGAKELLLGSGYLENIKPDYQRFDLNDTSDMKEKEVVVYQTLRNRGNVYVLGPKGFTLLYNASEWVRDMDSIDWDGDGVNDFLVAGGGLNIDYVETSIKQPASTKVNVTYKEGWTTCPDNYSRTNLEFVYDCEYQDYPDYVEKRTRITETIKPLVQYEYVRNRSEETWQNGSIFVYSSNGSLIAYGRYDEGNSGMLSIAPSERRDSFGNVQPFVASAAGKAIAFDTAFALAWEYSSLEEECIARGLKGGDVDGNGADDFLAYFSCPATDVVHLLDEDGKEIWQYRLIGDDIADVLSFNIDADDGTEVVVFSSKKIYVVDGSTGIPEWDDSLEKRGESFAWANFEGDEYKEVLLSTGKEIYVYEIEETFIKTSAAEQYYAAAKDKYEVGNYTGAAQLINRSIALYEEIGDLEGEEDASELAGKIETALAGGSKETASQLYKKGRLEFYSRNYDEARRYLSEALTIYENIKDDANAEKCRTALEEIEVAEGTSAATTSTAAAAVTTQPEANGNVEAAGDTFVWVLAGFAVVLLGFAAFYMMKSRKKPEGAS